MYLMSIRKYREVIKVTVVGDTAPAHETKNSRVVPKRNLSLFAQIWIALQIWILLYIVGKEHTKN